jgi:hypothetical protein
MIKINYDILYMSNEQSEINQSSDTENSELQALQIG